VCIAPGTAVQFMFDWRSSRTFTSNGKRYTPKDTDTYRIIKNDNMSHIVEYVTAEKIGDHDFKLVPYATTVYVSDLCAYDKEEYKRTMKMYRFNRKRRRTNRGHELRIVPEGDHFVYDDETIESYRAISLADAEMNIDRYLKVLNVNDRDTVREMMAERKVLCDHECIDIGLASAYWPVSRGFIF
jgi:hypothetical protein